MKFAFVCEEKVAFPVAVLCRVLSVATNGYYASIERLPSLRARRDREVVSRQQAPLWKPAGHADLKAEGQCVGRKRVARLMREQRLAARQRRRFRKTTNSHHGLPIAPNVLARDFTATAPNQKWVTDITFLRTREGWLYLAVILDLYSQRVVGWATSTLVDRHLALTALDMAVAKRRPSLGLVHHSDRGSTYAALEYRNSLKSRGLQCSMNRKGDCWDNAVAESFFATLKREMENVDIFAGPTMAALSVSEYIDGFYNLQRRHSSIDYASPIEFELLHCVETSCVTNLSTDSGQAHLGLLRFYGQFD